MIRRADGAGDFSTAESTTHVAAENKAPEKPCTDKLRKSVYIYIATLFLIVMLFTVLSYFVQQRNNTEISSLNEKNASAQQNIENLQTTNQQLLKESTEDKKAITQLQDQVKTLKEQLTSAELKLKTDVQTITDKDQVAYNELLAKYNELLQKTGTR